MRIFKAILAAVLSSTIAVQPVLAQEHFYYRYTKSLSSGSSSGGDSPGQGGNDTGAMIAVPKITGRYGHNLNVLAQSSGLTPPVTFSANTGVLPSGLAVNRDTGAIFGTPYQVGTFANVTIKGTDSANASAVSQPFEIDILPPLALGTLSTLNARVGAPFSKTFTATGINGDVTWNVSTSAPGLAAAGDTISGTPTAVGDYPVSVSVSDTGFGGDFKSGTTTLKVTAPQVTVGTYQTGKSGNPLTFTASVSNTVGTVTWKLFNAPAGMSVAASGTVTWANPVTGTYGNIILEADCSDRSFGVSAPVTVEITDGIPALSFQGYSPSTIHFASGKPVSVAAPQVTGGVSPYHFSSDNLPSGLSLDPTTGALSGSLSASASVSVKVADSQATPAQSSATVAFSVNQPPAVSGVSASYSATAGAAFSGITPSVTGGRSPFTWTIDGSLPSGLSFASGTGSISGTPSYANSATGLSIKVTDANGDEASSSPFSISVADALSLSGYAANYSLTSGAAAPAITPSVTGGAQPLKFTVKAGQLPNGLSLDAASGAISGTPDTAASYSATVAVEDANHAAAEATIAWSVAGSLSLVGYGGPYVRITGEAILFGPPNVIGGVAPYSFQKNGSWPAGLSLGSDGTISGSIGTPGNYSLSVKVIDANGAKADSAPVSVGVFAPVVLGDWASPAYSLTKGVSANIATPGASGGSGSFSWSVSSGSLPAGMAVNTATGAISGAPTETGTFTVAVAASDGVRTSSPSAPLTLVVAEPLSIAYSQASYQATQGQALTVPAPTVSGGDGSYSFYITSSDHRGMHVNADGSLTGAPTPFGTATFTVQVSDATGRTKSTSFTLNIAPALQVSGYSNVSYTAGGSAVAQTPTVIGGSSPYSFAASGSVAGLSLSSAGVLSGIPTESGTLTVVVTDAAGASVSSDVAVTVYPAPTWSGTISDAGFTAGVANGFILPQVNGGKVPLKYSWAASVTGKPAGLLVDQFSGAVSWTNPSGAQAIVGLAITVTDANNVSATSNTFSINVNDVPSIGSYPATPWLAGSQISIAKAPATGGTAPLTYQLANGTSTPAGVTLNADGTITGSTTSEGDYTFQVKVVDKYGAESVPTTATLSVWAQPTVSLSSPLPSTMLPGTAITPITVTSTGGKSPVNIVATGLPAGLTFSGGILQGTPTQTGTFSIQFTATEASSAHFSGKAGPYSVLVQSPLSVTSNSLPAAIVGQSYTFTPGAAGGTGTYSWSVSPTPPAGLQFVNGTLSGVPTGATNVALTFTANDGTSTASSAALTLDIAASPLQVGTTSLPTGVSGQSYNASLAASGGTPPYTWSRTSGALPSGVTLASSGVLSGLVSGSSVSGLYFQVRDAYNRTAAVGPLSISVVSSPLAITASPTLVVTQGVDFSTTFSATGGLAPYSWSFTPPAGMSFNSSTGVLSGKASSAAASLTTIPVSVTDATNTTVTGNVTISNAPPISLTSSSLPAGQVGTSYTASVSATGGRGTLSWASVSGMPAGLSLSSAGAFSGTPTAAGSYSPVIKVQDSDGRSLSVQPGIAISATLALSVSPAVPAYMDNGVAITPITFTASGGTPPYSYQWGTTTIPQGLVLDQSTGTISGTPMNGSGNFSLSVLVKDSSSPTPQTKYSTAATVHIGDPLSVTTNITGATIGRSYTATASVTGGLSAYTVSKLSGTLPGGVTATMSGTVVLISAASTVTSGSPGTSAVLRIQDSVGRIKDVTINIPVSTSSTAISPNAAANVAKAVVGIPYSQVFTGSGGNGPYTFSATGLPAGLSMGVDGTLSGTPNATCTCTVGITMLDADNRSASASFTMTVNPPMYLTVGYPSVVRAGLASTWSKNLTYPSGGSVTYQIVSASMNGTDLGTSLSTVGLGMDATGVISGTPSASGQLVVTMKASDAGTASPYSPPQDSTFTATVNVLPALSISNVPSTVNLTSGATNSYAIVPSLDNQPYGTQTWSVSPAFPAGLSFLSTATGVISQASNLAAGTYGPFTLTAKDNWTPQASASTTFTVVVAPGAAVNLPTVPTGSINVAYSLTPTTTAIGSGQTWQLLDTNGNTASLPSGMSLSATTGAISGTPTTTFSQTLKLKVTDSANVTATSQAFQLVINGGATADVIYPTSVTANGTTSWANVVSLYDDDTNSSLSANTGGTYIQLDFPQPVQTNGLTYLMTATGSFVVQYNNAGTWTQIGNSSFGGGTSGTVAFSGTVTASSFRIYAQSSNSSYFQTARLTYNNVAPKLTTLSAATYSSITNTVGTAITPITVAAPTNAVAPVTWSLSSTSVPLPAGLSLDPSTGTISGTPTAVADTVNGSSKLYLIVTDARGATGYSKHTVNFRALPTATAATVAPMAAAVGYGPGSQAFYSTDPLVAMNDMTAGGATTQTTYANNSGTAVVEIVYPQVVAINSYFADYYQSSASNSVEYWHPTQGGWYPVTSGFPTTNTWTSVPAIATSRIRFNNSSSGVIAWYSLRVGWNNATALTAPYMETNALTVTGTQGQALTYKIPASTVSNAQGGVTWTVNGGLPEGLSFDTSSGTFSGTPSNAGNNQQATLRATDGRGLTTSSQRSLTVTFNIAATTTVDTVTPSFVCPNGSCSTVYIPYVYDAGAGGTDVSASSVGINNGQVLEIQFPQPVLINSYALVASATGGVIQYKDTQGGWQNWVAPATSGLNVTGPSAVTSTSLRWYNSTGNSVSVSTFRAEYNGASILTPAVTGTLTVNGTAGQAITPVQATAANVANAQGGLTWSYSGTLPTGLSFDPATATISGMPSTYSSSTTGFQIFATDSRGFKTQTGIPVTFKIDSGVTADTVMPSGVYGNQGYSSNYLAAAYDAGDAAGTTDDTNSGVVINTALSNGYIEVLFPQPVKANSVRVATGGAMNYNVQYLNSGGGWTQLTNSSNNGTWTSFADTTSNRFRIANTSGSLSYTVYTVRFGYNNVTPLAPSVKGSLSAITGTVGSPITPVGPTAANLVNAQGTVTWQISSGTLAPGLSFDSSTGTISGTPTTWASGSAYKVNLVATDGRGLTTGFYLPVNVTINVAETAADFLPSTIYRAGNSGYGNSLNALYDATDASGTPMDTTSVAQSSGEYYEYTYPVPVAANSAKITYTNAGVSGRVDYMAADGTWTNIVPYTVWTSIGTFSSTVTSTKFRVYLSGTSSFATGRIGYNGSSPLAPSVTGSAPAITGQMNAPITNVDVSGIVKLNAVGTVTYSATGLPAGLSISSAGIISGTPTSFVSGTYQVFATDGRGITTASSASGSVTTAASLTADTVVPSGIAVNGVSGGMQDLSAMYDATAGGADFATTYRVVNASSGYVDLVFASPVRINAIFAAASSYAGTSIQYYDANSTLQTPGISVTSAGWKTIPEISTQRIRLRNTSAGSVNITSFRAGYNGVAPVAPSTPGSALSISGVLNDAFSYTLADSNVVNGKAPFTWAVTSGSLPTGLSISGNVISGTIKSSTSTAVYVRVTDANGFAADQTLQVNQSFTVPSGTTTLDAATKAAGTTFTNGNLTSTCNTSNNCMTRATVAKSSGKYYFEYTTNTVSSKANGHYGLGDGTVSFSTGYLKSVVDLSPTTGTGGLTVAGSTVSAYVPANQVSIGFAVDLDAHLVWPRVNGSWVGGGDPATGTGGYSIPAGTFYPQGTADLATATFTANFGATAYSYAKPSGFSNWQ